MTVTPGRSHCYVYGRQAHIHNERTTKGVTAQAMVLMRSTSSAMGTDDERGRCGDALRQSTSKHNIDLCITEQAGVQIQG